MKVYLPDLPLPITVELVDDEGFPLPSKMENGLEIVDGTLDTQFKIRLENPNTPEIIQTKIPRIYIVVGVDGINIGDLQTIDWRRPMSFQRGFVWTIDSGAPTQIDYFEGWLLNKHELSRFKFVSREKSMLATQYPMLFDAFKDLWCGKIEVAFYVESLNPPPKVLPRSRREISVGEGEVVENPHEYIETDFVFREPHHGKACGMASMKYRVREG